MARVIGKGKSVPVIPGPEVGMLPACAACGAGVSEMRVRTAIAGIDMALCADPAACCRRYRGHLVPAVYATNLRAQVAA